MPPHYASPESVIQNSLISEGCNIEGHIDFSVLFAGVTIEPGAVVRDSIIMPNTTIKKGAVVEYAIVGEDCVIVKTSRSVQDPSLSRTRIHGALR